MNTDLSLSYLLQEPKQKNDKNPLILLLHGYGSNEEDLFSFASELSDDYYVISTRAPYPVPPYGFAWYAITFDNDMNKFSDDDQAIESRDLLVKFIDELCSKYPIDSKNINLVGFSQGAIISYAIALTYPEKIHKVVALSGYFNSAIMNPKTDISAYSHLKIFGSHGTADQIIPIEWARQTKDFLEPFKIPFEYREYPVGHGVHPNNFIDFKKFITE